MNIKDIENEELIPSNIKIDIIYYFRKNVEEITIQDYTPEGVPLYNCHANLANGWILSGSYTERGFEVAIIPQEFAKGWTNQTDDDEDWLNIENIDIYNVDIAMLAKQPKHGSSVNRSNIEYMDAWFELAKALPDPHTFYEWQENYQKINEAISDIKIFINTGNYKE